MGDPSSNMLQYAFDCFQHFFDKTVFYHKWSAFIQEMRLVVTSKILGCGHSRLRENGSQIFETRHHRKDGNVFDVEIAVTWLDRDVHQSVCFCRDITERIMIEMALKRENAFVEGFA